MKITLVAVYHVPGAARFAQDASTSEVFRSGEITANLTDDATLAVEHFYRAGAIAKLVLTRLTGSDGKTPQEVLNAAVAEGKSEHAKRFKTGLFLVFEVEREIANVNLTAMADMGDYGIAIDAVDKVELRNGIDPVIEGVLTAVVASLPANADTRVTKVGEVAFLQQDKPIYAMTMKMGSATLSISSLIDIDMLARAATFATELAADSRLTRAVHLHSIAANTETDKLLAFLAAWAALEVFANATYKDRYNDEWYALLQGAAPGPAKAVISRLEEVMKDKLRLVDKFSVIASILDPVGSAEDIAQFAAIKKIRDEFFHALQGGSDGFPSDAALNLFRKYLRLHVAHKNAM